MVYNHIDTPNNKKNANMLARVDKIVLRSQWAKSVETAKPFRSTPTNEVCARTERFAGVETAKGASIDGGASTIVGGRTSEVSTNIGRDILNK